MTVLSPDRVLQNSTTIGTADYALLPVTRPFRPFSASYANNAKIPYCATDGQMGYEIAIGTLIIGASDTLQRGPVILSSNANNPVSWSGTTKQIFAWDVACSAYVSVFNADFALVAGDWGTAFVFAGGLVRTATLPTLSGIPRGWAVRFKNAGSAVCNVAPHTGDEIDTLGISTAYPLAIGASATFATDGSVWRAIDESGITALTGDVTATGPGSAAATITANAVTNAKAAQMPAHTFKGNNTGSTANSSDLTATQATAALDAFVGDSGSGGTKGLTPPPSSGDAAAGKFLKADGTWTTVPGASGITALTGDVTATGPGSVASTIAAHAVTNSKAAQMAAHTFKGNNTGSTADSIDLTATQATAELNTFVGDSGSGGTKGLVPAPASGDGAAGKFLKADGTFAVPPGAGTGTAATIRRVNSGSSDSVTVPTTTRTHILWNSNSGAAKSQTIPDPTLYDGYDVDVFDFFGDSGTNAITVTPAGTGTITVASLGSVANLALQSAYGNLSFRAIAALNTWIVT